MSKKESAKCKVSGTHNCTSGREGVGGEREDTSARVEHYTHKCIFIVLGVKKA